MAKAKGRSPNYPRLSLEKAIQMVKSIHQQAHTATINQETVARAMGYSGLNGAALRNMAALIAYGLLDRKNQDVSVSELSLKILFPTNDTARLSAIQTAALNPKLFNTIHERYGMGAAPVIRNQLICEQQFTPDGAQAATNVYLENKEYAQLTTLVSDTTVESEQDTAASEDKPESPKGRKAPDQTALAKTDNYTVSITGPKIQFSVVVSDETDLMIIEAMLKKVKTFINEEHDSE